MLRILTGFVAVAALAVVPSLAQAGNNEIADQIGRNLRNSGQLSDYKIAVKYQDGTASLRGHVADEQQMSKALRLVFQTPGVNRVVNELTLASAGAGKSASSEAVQPTSQPAAEQPAHGSPAYYNPLRGQQAAQKVQQPQRLGLTNFADRLSSSFRAGPLRATSAEESWDAAPQQMPAPRRARPMATAYTAMRQYDTRGPTAPSGGPMPMYTAAAGGGGPAPARYDQPCLPNYAWPSYAAYPNYAAVTYPKQYSPTAWPYIGPFYPYPQVPLGWRKVTLEWDDGWWFLDFKDQPASCWHR